MATVGLGRVAVLDQGVGAHRVLRALRELSRAGLGSVAVAVHGPADRTARFVREADDAVERTGSFEEALREARASTGWLGAATLAERAAFAEACARAGARHVGPPAEVLRRLLAPEATVRLAAELGVAAAPSGGLNPGAHQVEVIVARDAAGHGRVLGVADTSLALGGLPVLVEAPSPALDAAGEAVLKDLGLHAASASGWTGVVAVRFLVDASSRKLALAGLDAVAHGAPAVEANAGVDLVRLALRLSTGEALEPLPPPAHGHAFAARLLAQDPEAPPAAPGKVELL
ncbi:MAG TPA: biotin carboxylase N-terminal domain-containing protein, partial [Anaeromyxobacteraceae bacterium]|nr:biotin carboxylase N-terminal domain-containing protein [Anaeromyxobacteraceae bacterium]